MTIQELAAGESKSVEFKESLPEKSIKYTKTVVAFANDNGGKLIFGIQDNICEVVGIPDDDIFKTMDAITNAISDSCELAKTTRTTQTTQSTTQSTTQTTQSTTQSIQLTDQDKQVLRIIAAEPSITQPKLALKIGWPVDRVKYYIRKLREKGILCRNGTGRNGTWEIIIGEDIWQN